MANEVVSLNTRGEIATHIAGKVQQGNSTAIRNEILRDLDHLYRRVLARKPWPQLIRYVESAISQSANAAFFYLPKDVRKIISLQDATTPINIERYSAASMFSQMGGFASLNGLSCEYAPVGSSATNVSLPAGTALEIVSDGTDVRPGFLRGQRSDEQKTQSFTLTSAVAVSLGLWDEASLLELGSSSQSRTVIMRIVGGATVSTIAPNETVAAYQRYRLFPVPGGTVVLRIIYKYTPPQIFDENHQYIIPVQDYLVQAGLAAAYSRDRKWAPAMQVHQQQAEECLQSIFHETFGDEIEVAAPLFIFGGNIKGGIIVNRHGG